MQEQPHHVVELSYRDSARRLCVYYCKRCVLGIIAHVMRRLGNKQRNGGPETLSTLFSTFTFYHYTGPLVYYEKEAYAVV